MQCTVGLRRNKNGGEGDNQIWPKKTNEMQHPTLFPKPCRIAELVLSWCHEQVAHDYYRGMTMKQIRSSGSWVTRCNSFGQMYYLEVCQVQAVERKVSATKNGRFAQREKDPPFTCCGVDLFGSFLKKDGWKEVKEIWCSVYLPTKQGHTH